ncbi:uncharacterized protein LOC127791998 isoform X2 [Diospyros lotus]|uniref:uncharacterized protein LOC127791998 isoform X2 n=1 Tax=Diospyros lotus TaxID=55363 RepID=UPI00225561BC|nr:uncharacterized protein LOC127791998 isoform X2 [Diospyros lotus]
MARVLETLAVPRASSVPASTMAPMGTTSSVSALPGSQKSLELPRFRGLRIQTSCRTRSLASFSSSSRIVRPGARIVCEAPQTAVEATDETWNSLVLESDCPVLVDFWAPWCGPCRVIEPVIDELAKEYTGKLKCYKVNTDESPSIATRYGIRSIPTVLIFKSGEKKGSVSGAVPKSTLTNLIEKFL